MEFGKTYKIGNFNVFKYKKGDYAYVKVAEDGGEWAVEYGIGSLLYSAFDSASEEELEALRTVIVNTFCVSTLIDAGLQHEVQETISKFIDSIKAPDVSDEEDAEIIKDLKEGQRLEEEMDAEE